MQMDSTADWIPLGDITYRKATLYENLDWKDGVSIASSFIAISKCGGLIAIIRDELAIGGNGLNKRPMMMIFNSAGKEISQFRWNSGTLIGIDWTHEEDLICVQEDGQILMYSIFGEFLKSFSMGSECRESKILEFKVFISSVGTGVIVLSGLYRFFVVSNVTDPKLRKLANILGLSNAPTSWCVMPNSREPRVLVANEANLYLVDSGTCMEQTPSALESRVTAFIEMGLSINNKHIVLYADTGAMWMGSSDLQEKYCEFNTGKKSRPNKLLWCSDYFDNSTSDWRNSAVIVYRPGTILIVGMFKDWYRMDTEDYQFNNSPSTFLSLDYDGIHVLSVFMHEYIGRVSTEVQNIYKIGSTAPGALLNMAAKEYSKSSQKADEYMRDLMEKHDLQTAIEQCIMGAESEFMVSSQKNLMTAASFGKAFQPDMTITDLFVNACHTLRVLNGIRDRNIGMTLTANQLLFISLNTLIDRLIVRRQFPVAFEVCKYLRIPDNLGTSRILAHWACYKIQQTDLSDDRIAQAIKNKLKAAKSVSYASIAEKAVDCDRKNLAVKLLDFEQKASEQVRLLMKLGQHTLALEKAIISGDTNLTYQVIGRLRECSSLSDFLVTIRQHKTAYNLYLKSCKDERSDMLKHLHEQEDNFIDLAHCFVRESYNTFVPEDRFVNLQEAMKNFTQGKDEFAAKMTDEQMKLLRHQASLEQGSDEIYVETSLHDTLYKLLVRRDIKRAETLRKEFKVSDKRWWLLRIQVLAELGLWQELEDFSKSKKSPVGFLPFVEMCVKYNGTNEIAKYINKVSADKKVPALLKAGMLSQAAEIAMQTKNAVDLDMVLKRCGIEHREIAEQVRSFLTQLHK